MEQLYIFDNKVSHFIEKKNVERWYYDGFKYNIKYKGNEIIYTYDSSKVRIVRTGNVTEDKEGRRVMTNTMASTREDSIIEYLLLYCEHQAELVQQQKGKTEPENEEEKENTDVHCPFDSVKNGLSKVVYKDTVLGEYLSAKRRRTALRNYSGIIYPIIFPFGCNYSQHKAVSNALLNSISVIEGPPGTGKTQTILNLIANIIHQGKTVAIVSNNNSAVDNVIEKLDKQGLSWLAAQLGNVNNVNNYFRDGIPDVCVREEWHISQKDKNVAFSRLKVLDGSLEELFQNQIDQRNVERDLQELLHQKEVFLIQHEVGFDQISSSAELFHGWRKERLEKFEARFIRFSKATGLRHLAETIRLFILTTWRFRLYIQHRDTLLLGIALAKYEVMIESLKDRKKELDTLSKDNSLLEEYVELSRKTFFDTIYNRFVDKKFSEFTKENYKEDLNFRKRFPIITSSTYSLANCSGTDPYDYVIVDESSQVNLPTGALCMSLANNIVIVGDTKQLPHIADQRSLHPCNGVSSYYDAVDESILSSTMKVFGDRIPSTMLMEHYRCHPRIIDFCNKRFYDGKMVIMTRWDDSFPFDIVDTPSGKIEYSKGSPANMKQLQESLDIVKESLNEGIKPNELGVISPYHYHAEVLRKRFCDRSTEADTVHRFQGREKDVIIYNSVKNVINPFNDDPHLINVAVSRAKKRFVLVASKEEVLKKSESNLAALVKYIDYYDLARVHTRKSLYSSVFDCLYQKGFTIKGKGKESVAETLFREMLEKVLSRHRGLEYRQEYYLIHLVRDIRMFTQDEFRFMSNGSRLDFLIYEKIGNEPLLAVEVDGKTHDTAQQHQRDALKDSILDKIGLSHCRYRTDNVLGGEEKSLEEWIRKAIVDRIVV